MSPTSTATGPAEPSLTDRYVHAVTRRLPDDQRADVAEELRGSIADRVEALAEDRPDLDGPQAERAALEELGDPDLLSAGYAGRPMHLIGPDYFPAYRRTLVGLAVGVLPVVAVVLAVLEAIDGGSVGSVIGGTVWVVFVVAVQIAFWVTLAFALAERGGDDDVRSSLGGEWSPDRLPALPSRRGSINELVAGLVWIGFFGTALVWQQVRPLIDAGAESVPVLDPDLWSFWLPLILVLLLAEMAFEVVKYRLGWSPLLAVVNVVLGAVFAAPIVYLAATDRLLNPAAVAAIQDEWSGFDPGTVNTIVIVSALVIWVWDAVDGWRKATAADRAVVGS